MRIAAIVPSAGSGRRMHSKTDKPFIRLGKKEIICYCLRRLQNSSSISEIIVVASNKNIPRLKRLITKEGFSKVGEVVRGGRKRADSVLNGLSRVSSDIDLVLIHDCARPFLNQGLINRTLTATKRYKASLSAVLVKPTIKEASPKKSFVKKTLERRFLWEAQTPQAFDKRLLIKAYQKAGKEASSFTDSASLVENIGKQVKIVKGEYNNIKITTPEDLILAATILERSSTTIKKGV